MNYKKIFGSLMAMLSIVVVSSGAASMRNWCRRHAKKLKRQKIISNDFIC